MQAWHFLPADKKLANGDGRLVRVGKTFKCDPDSLELCKTGFHGSKRIIDALQYARGPIICKVELGGRILKGDDKCVASERTVIAMADATNTLHEMACWAAEQALKLIDKPDPRSVAAIQAKRKWLRGEITDAELNAAWAAAGAAAGDAADDAADAAAWAAAGDAARAAQNKQLTKMVNDLLRKRTWP